MVSFPGSLDNFTNPSNTDALNNPSHSTQHQNANDAIEALEAKVGITASTPTNNTFLIGDGSGSSSWSALTSAQLASRVSDETGSGSLVFGTSPTFTTSQSVNGAAGTNRSIFFNTAGSNRIEIGAGNTAEAGANAGSDFFLNTYADNGAYLATPMVIERSTGETTFNANVNIVGATNNAGDVVTTNATQTLTNKTIEGNGYSLMTMVVVTAPADSTTYYSDIGFAGITTADRQRIYIPQAGTITKAYVSVATGGTLGTTETSTLSLRLNNTTDTTITSSLANNALTVGYSNTALSIAVAAGDYIQLKWPTPAWATNPTNVEISAFLWITQ